MRCCAAVERMTTNETRTQLAADAGILAHFLKTGYVGWNAQTREQLLNLALDSTCEVHLRNVQVAMQAV